jgi:hypothetical protein
VKIIIEAVFQMRQKFFVYFLKNLKIEITNIMAKNMLFSGAKTYLSSIAR